LKGNDIELNIEISPI